MEQKLSYEKIDKMKFIRELTFRSIYAADLGSEVDDQLFEMISKDVAKRTKKQTVLDDVEKVQVRNKVKSVQESSQELELVISKHLVGWKMDRLPIVVLCILRMSVYDLLYNQDVPNNVIISEAVLLAERFSGDKDKKFINGLLSSVNKQLAENDNDTEKLLATLKAEGDTQENEEK